jgi:hypothetical protein
MTAKTPTHQQTLAKFHHETFACFVPMTNGYAAAMLRLYCSYAVMPMVVLRRCIPTWMQGE